MQNQRTTRRTSRFRMSFYAHFGRASGARWERTFRLVRSGTIPPFLHSVSAQFFRPSFPLCFIRAFLHYFVTFFHSFLHSFRSFVHSFFHSLFHSFIPSLLVLEGALPPSKSEKMVKKHNFSNFVGGSAGKQKEAKNTWLPARAGATALTTTFKIKSNIVGVATPSNIKSRSNSTNNCRQDPEQSRCLCYRTKRSKVSGTPCGSAFS